MIAGFMFVIGALGALMAIFLVLGLITAIGQICGDVGDAMLPKQQRQWQPDEPPHARSEDMIY